MDTGCAAYLSRATSALTALSAQGGQVMPMGKKIIKIVVFLVILLAVLILLTVLSPKAM